MSCYTLISITLKIDIKISAHLDSLEPISVFLGSFRVIRAHLGSLELI